MHWAADHLTLVLSLGALVLGLWQLAPRRNPGSRGLGWLLTLGGGLTLAWLLEAFRGPAVEEFLFLVFGGGALLCGVLMVTSHNPVYAALWFALVTFCTCGLFLLQSAPFLAAATVIVYAGAIIVTFIFVIMLAQQSGAAVYDLRSRRPLIAAIGAAVLLGALLTTLQGAKTPAMQPPPAVAREEGMNAPNPLSRIPADQPLGTMHGLGRSLFGDYLFAVELAGTLLLVASIGAIAIAPRREQGTL
jgi:NADH-quinone oxidoreductase subunit J